MKGAKAREGEGDGEGKGRPQKLPILLGLHARGKVRRQVGPLHTDV